MGSVLRYADFEPIFKDKIDYEHQPMRLIPMKEDGTSDIGSLNAGFTQEHLDDKPNSRWFDKPTVDYLWARTVTRRRSEEPVANLLRSRRWG